MNKRLSFSQFVRESKDTMYFTFARMNPPTMGHELLLDSLEEMSGSFPYSVYLSPTHNDKNPLVYEDKVKLVRRTMPRHSRQIRETSTVKNILEAASDIYSRGYSKIVMGVGADRKVEFSERLKRYNGVQGRHGLYEFSKIQVVSVGNRSGKSLLESISATSLRESAANGDFITFCQGLPKSADTQTSKLLFDKVRDGLGLNEYKAKAHRLSLGEISEERQKYIKGDLFSVGDDVVIEGTEVPAKIAILGANYVIVEKSDGTRLRKWLNDVKKQ